MNTTSSRMLAAQARWNQIYPSTYVTGGGGFNFRLGPGEAPPEDGGAGVREPRRPRLPAAPAAMVLEQP